MLRFSHFFVIHRDELIALRTLKPAPGERKEIEKIPPPKPATPEAETTASKADAGSVSLMDKVEDESPINGNPSQSTTIEADAANETPFEESVEEEKKGEDEFVENDSDSEEAVGREDAAKEDRNLDDDDSENAATDELDASAKAGTVSEMFQRLLNMSGANNGQMALQVGNQTPSSTQSPAVPTPGSTGNNAYTFSASTLHAGRMICTLPDHPIHAGATAVVAVMIGKTLVVANAGDSRAVLCRDGAAFALSYDHKPQQEREINRIRRAGGFVNQFGRVNGNLNLSRSIGDLKYKQAFFLPPADQMITAEPDILQ